jgi:hypothetical protein
MARSADIDRNTSHDLAVIGLRVLDDAHMTWLAAEIDSENSLRAWFKAAPANRAPAYLAYRAALDREEAAARDLQRLDALTRPCQERLARGG